MSQKLVMSILGVAMCLCIAMPVFAEAPVFDADNMQQDDELPMPPAPGQEAAMDGPPPALGSAPAPVPVSAAPTTSTSQRLQRLEQQLANLQENGSAPRVESLQKEVQGLRSQVEQLTHQLQQSQTQQKAMYSDLDKRVSSNATADVGTSNTVDTAPVAKTERVANAKPAAKTLAGDTVVALAATTTAKAVPVPATANVAAGANDPQPNVAEEQQIYQTAYNFIKAKKYNEAINALQGMLQKYPSGQFASNAHYWLGELYGLVGKNDQALSEFNIVVKTYSSSPRVSDAQLKIGLLYAAQVKWPEAKTAFKKVINRYPGTSSAKLAALQLKQIKEAGH